MCPFLRYFQAKPDWKYCKSHGIINLISYQIHPDTFQVLKLATSQAHLVSRSLGHTSCRNLNVIGNVGSVFIQSLFSFGAFETNTCSAHFAKYSKKELPMWKQKDRLWSDLLACTAFSTSSLAFSIYMEPSALCCSLGVWDY